MLPCCMSSMLLAAVANAERRWRKLQFYCALPALLPFLISVFLHQSPRWLRATGRIKKAEKVLNKVAEFNKRVVNHHLSPINETRVKKYSYIDSMTEEDIGIPIDNLQDVAEISGITICLRVLVSQTKINNLCGVSLCFVDNLP